MKLSTKPPKGGKNMAILIIALLVVFCISDATMSYCFFLLPHTQLFPMGST